MSQQSGDPGAAGQPAADNRPEFRVALFGVTAQLHRVLEAVARHAQHNPYRFRVADNRSANAFDIALVDMTTSGGPEVAGTLRQMLNGVPVVKLGRRQDPSRGLDDVVHDSFGRQVLSALNRFVDSHLQTLAAQAGAAIPAAPVSAAPVAREESRRARALIVDDSPTVRRQLAGALNQMGMDSEAVASAREALDLLALREYELVFADVMMPELDGYQLTREIKRDRTLKGLPVIILTSRSSPFDLARGALAGCSSYLVKPVSLQSLRDTVNRQLRKVVSGRKGADSLLGTA